MFFKQIHFVFIFLLFFILLVYGNWDHISTRWSGTEHTQIFPDTVYPGAESPDPNVEAGAQFGQRSPPHYPSPWIEGLGNWRPAYEKARALVSQMTLLEKVNVTTGSECFRPRAYAVPLTDV